VLVVEYQHQSARVSLAVVQLAPNAHRSRVAVTHAAAHAESAPPQQQRARALADDSRACALGTCRSFHCSAASSSTWWRVHSTNEPASATYVSITWRPLDITAQAALCCMELAAQSSMRRRVPLSTH
jgi:hypothetical protein